MKVFKMFPALMAAAFLSGGTRLAGLSLPVYQVVQSGATAPQAANLSAALVISPGLVPQVNGLVSFVDTNTYLRVPAITVTDATITNELLAASKNPVPSIPLVFNAFDFTALSHITAVNGNVALDIASNALQSAGLFPANAVPVTGNDWFTAFYTNDFGQVISNSGPLDTRVSWRLSTPNDYPLVGPGAQIQFTFGPTGNVSRLLYSARQLQAGPMVQIISSTEASNRLAQMFPANTQFTLQLVYWSPPFRAPPSPCYECPPTVWNPTNIIPWFEASGSLTLIDPVTGGQETIQLKAQMIPATDDSRFVPTVSLNASGPAPVSASATVSGGQPPYAYMWAGSDTSASTNVGDSITYTPRVRVAFPPLNIGFNSGGSAVAIAWPDPSTGFVLQSATDLRSANWSPITNGVTTGNGLNRVTVPTAAVQFFRLILSTGLPQTDAVTVHVTDANGVSGNAVEYIPVVSQPIPAKLNGPVSYGCESPYPFQTARVYWETGMAWPGAFGGVEAFCWTSYNSWPGDYVVPSPPGSIPAKPWADGDADYANFGVDTANIVLYNGDGDPTGRFFAEMDPTVTVNQYPASYLYHPSGQYSLEEFFYSQPSMHYVDYDNAWGAIGKNHNLDWLCMYACNTLTNTMNIQVGSPPWKRWGPAFNGLHAMFGFFSPASDLEIGLCVDFPGDMLGINTKPEFIVEAWVDAAISDDVGVPAAMGPIGPGGVNDFTDFYWGRGDGVGPSIPNSLITGWWYVIGSTVVVPP
jgi:Family of unknown function (DUF6345)